VTLGHSADCRIARHLANQVQIDGNKSSLSAEARRSVRSLATCVASANHEHVILLVITTIAR